MSKVPGHLVNRYPNLPREWKTGQIFKLATGYAPQHVDSIGYSSYRDRLLSRNFSDIGIVKELGPIPRWLHSHVSNEREFTLFTPFTPYTHRVRSRSNPAQSCYLHPRRSSLSDQRVYLCVRMSHPRTKKSKKITRLSLYPS